jgi:hypothetical protein
MAIRFPRFTAARRQKALAEAEKEFGSADMKRGKRKHVSIRTSEIKERLELFQPREFSYGAVTVNADWVKELAKRIGIHGELDPVLVIRIGKEWVCVDLTSEPSSTALQPKPACASPWRRPRGS